MKRLIAIMSIFLFVLFSINTISVLAQPQDFTQGFYTMKDLRLSESIPYSVQNTSPYNRGVVIVMDENQTIQQLLRLPPASPKYNLTPLKNSFHFILYGDGIRVVFS